MNKKPAPNFAELAARFPANGHIVMHSDFAEPVYLSALFSQYAGLFKSANLHTLMPMAPPLYAEESIASQLQVNSFFPGGGLRKAVSQGLVKVKRCVLSEIPQFFVSGEIKADLLLLQVTPPNAEGKVSLGVSVDYMQEVLSQNPIVVAQINPQMPFTCGDTLVDWSAIDYCIEHEEPLIEFSTASADPVDTAIAKHVAALIDDGDIVQAGIGALPDAVLASLGHLKHLGVHTGILTQAWMPLIESGVVDNSTKSVFKGKTITTMAGGDKTFYKLLDKNKSIEFHPCALTHSFETLSAIENLCAVNSVLQMDLSANANAERVNGRLISTPGGLPDFAKGASAAKGGKSIIALRSSFKEGKFSNIVTALGDDSPVTIDAKAITHVVTEYGVAALRNLNVREKAEALIAIAHPSHIDSLTEQWRAEQ